MLVLLPRKRFPADVAQNEAPKAAEIKINLAFVTQTPRNHPLAGAERRRKKFSLPRQSRLSFVLRDESGWQNLQLRLRETEANDPLTKNHRVSSFVCLSLMDFCV